MSTRLKVPDWLVGPRTGWQTALPQARRPILAALRAAAHPIPDDPKSARRFEAAFRPFGVFLDDAHNLSEFGFGEREGTRWWSALLSEPPDARFAAALIAARYAAALRPLRDRHDRTRLSVALDAHIQAAAAFSEHALRADCQPAPADFAEFATLVDRVETKSGTWVAIERLVSLAQRICTPEPPPDFVGTLRTTAQRWAQGDAEVLWLPAKRLRRLAGLPDAPTLTDADYPLAWAFELLNELACELLASFVRHQLGTTEAGRAILALPPAERAAILRCAAAGGNAQGEDLPAYCPPRLRRSRWLPRACWTVLVELLPDASALGDDVLGEVLERFSANRLAWACWQGRLPAYRALLRCVTKRAKQGEMPPAMKRTLARLADELYEGRAAERKLSMQVRTLLGGPPTAPIEAGEAWADQALADINADARNHDAWCSLLQLCADASASAPPKRWTSTARERINDIGVAAFKSAVGAWFALLNRPRNAPPPGRGEPTYQHHVTDPNADVLRGLAWACASLNDPELARPLSILALSAYRKYPGPELIKVGNACVWALGQMPGREVLAQLAILKARVKSAAAQKLIDKALTTAGEKAGLACEEIEELAVPAYGLEAVGRRRETFGDYTAELLVRGARDVAIHWRRPDGRPLKSAPAAVKKQRADQARQLAQLSKDIQRMLPAQRERLDALFLARKSWPLPVWRERYLDHPLVGVLARALIWRFATERRAADGIYLDEGLHDVDGRPLDWLDDSARVELWHPIGRPVDEVLAWRDWLERHEVRQPFKQAHREVYLLTDAERSTRTYSNRFAAHILRQHQFNALCAARSWKNKLRLLVDDEYPPATRLLPAWNLRAEFWIECVGDEYGADTNAAGVFHRVATDQVRFYPLDAAQRTAHAGGGGYHPAHGRPIAAEPLALEDVPPLVLSEVMRDVDLFVGVASVGNDPAWEDGGPGGQFRDYWSNYAWGELGESARTRKAVLERLIPRLKIADRCALRDRFLTVRGDLRTYKIHLGSANILMEPDNVYLCIVPARGAAAGGKGDKLYLPFEGDERLAVILSKAFLLADDRNITDPTITAQITGR